MEQARIQSVKKNELNVTIQANDTKNDYDVTKDNIKEHNPNWPQIPDHPYGISITGGSRSEKKQIHYLI